MYTLKDLKKYTFFYFLLYTINVQNQKGCTKLWKLKTFYKN